MTSTAPTREGGWAYAEQFLPEDDVLLEARRQAQLRDLAPVRPGTGAALRLMAAAMGARAVVEVGTGTGVSGLWLLRGMHPDGVLTSVDLEPDPQRVAREVFAAAGFSGSRVRLINGFPLSVLPRLADGGYDLVLLDVVDTVAPEELPAYVEEAVRLLRPGGLLALDKALRADDRTGPGEQAQLRAVAEQLRDDERLLPSMLPVGDGLLCAVRRVETG